MFSLFGQFQAQVDQIEEKVVIAEASEEMVSLSDDEETSPALSAEEIQLLAMKDFQTAFLTLVAKPSQTQATQSVEEKKSPILPVKETV